MSSIWILFTIISITLGQRAPKIVVQPVDFINRRAISRSHSEGLVIPCTAIGYGTIAYSWKHNGQPLQADQRIRIQGGNLTFSGIVLADAGKYVCLATNSLGTSVSREATLQVRYLPFLPGGTTTLTRSLSNIVKVKCNISPNTAPRPDQIYWTKSDGSIVKESKRIALTRYNGDLIFLAGLTNETGRYRCNTISDIFDPKSRSTSATTLTGGYQTVNFTSNIFKNSLPSIEVAPNDTTAEIGDKKVILECVAAGYPIPTILWSKRSGTLPINRYKFENYGRHLVLQDIQESDYGDYQCTAISDGMQVSASAKLSVVSELTWSVSIADRNYSIESDISWPCLAAGSNIRYKWFMNGNQIIASSKYLLHSNGSLTIRNLDRSDSKVYTCMAYNDRSNIVSSGWLNVTVAAPSFVELPYARTSLFKGEDGIIRCTVTGGPYPMMAYAKDDRFIDLLRNLKYTVMKNGNLIVHNVNENDAGTYKCVATNRFGTATVSGVAVVMNATIITRKLVTTTIRRSRNISLMCQAQSESSLSVAMYWQRNGVNITSPRAKITTTGLTTVLKFYNATLEDSGIYACVATTHLPYQGSYLKISKALITVHDVPDAPFNFRYSGLASNSVLLSWLPGNPNNSPLQKFQIKYRINSINSWRFAHNSIPVSATFHRVNLSPFNSYTIAINAVNGVGTSADSKYISFITPADVPYYAPGKFRARAVLSDASAIDIEFVPLSRERQNDMGINYRLFYRQHQSNTAWYNITVGISGNYRLTGLAPATSYQLQLQPFNNAGTGKLKTNTLTVVTGKTPPNTAPTDVMAYITGINQVTLTWKRISSNRSSTVTGYRVSFWIYDRSMASTRTFGDINRITLKGFQLNMNYSFTINAFNEGGDGPLSPVITKSINKPVPGAVSSLVASQFVIDQVIIRWKAPLNSNGVITHYMINCTSLNSQDIAGLAISNTTSSATTEYILYNMKSGKYLLTVIPSNINGYGIPATIQYETVDTTIISAPTDLTASNIQETSVDLNWMAVDTTLKGFIIQSKLDLPGNSFTNNSQIISPKTRQFTVNNLISSSTYIFHIIAVGVDDKFSLPSNQVNVTTAPRKEPMSTMTISIIGGAAGFAVIVAAIVIFACYQRRHRTKKSCKPHNIKPIVPPLPVEEPEIVAKRPPLPTDSKHLNDQFDHSDVDAESIDSMDQYADLPSLSKFNENGSFIGEYGIVTIIKNVENSSYGAHYSEVKYGGTSAASVCSGYTSRPGSRRGSRPGSPVASTMNHQNSGFLTFV